jgi:hypothetical protein
VSKDVYQQEVLSLKIRAASDPLASTCAFHQIHCIHTYTQAHTHINRERGRGEGRGEEREREHRIFWIIYVYVFQRNYYSKQSLTL